MAGLFDKISTFIGATKVEDYEDEGYVEDDYYDEAEEEEQPSRGRSRQGGKQNITALPSATKQKLIIYKPVSYEDADTAIDQLKSRRPVIVNIVELISTSIETAQRVHDYLRLTAGFSASRKEFMSLLPATIRLAEILQRNSKHQSDLSDVILASGLI